MAKKSHKTLLFGHMFLWPDQNQVQGVGFYQQNNLWLGTVWFGLVFFFKQADKQTKRTLWMDTAASETSIFIKPCAPQADG